MSLTDMNICQNSVASESEETTTNDSCMCPPEYYCTYICDEGFSQISTPISWQHFPRSTSSRSRCDDSSEEILKSSVSGSTVESPGEEEKKSKRLSSASEYPITKSFSQLRAQHYLEIRHIFEFLNFLISHLVCNEPEDPVQFLVDLLDKCLKYRDSFGEPPLLFTDNHLKSLYNAFDPFERGHLTLDQYEEAMRTLALENNITSYNKEPTLNDEGFVDQDFFVAEVERCLTENLKKMLRIPKMWEENRLLWRKRMQKKAFRAAQEADSEFYGELEKEEDNEKKIYCNCGHPTKNIICQCGRVSEIKCELEQLYLD